MIKTKIKKAIAIASIVAISATSFGIDVFAATNVGLATVAGDASFDTNIVWDDNFPGFATGAISGIVVTANVLPTINMEISTGSIDFGTLTPGVEVTRDINIEVGTNAVGGVMITANSTNGGLNNTTDASIQINSLSVDENAENYSFASVAGTDDSSYISYASVGDLTKTEITDSSLKTIYNTNKPELTDSTDVDVVFTVATTANAQTPAGAYEDNITLVVSGRF